MSEKDLTLAENNRLHEDRAHQIMYEAVRNALEMQSRGIRVANIVIRIPMNGAKLLAPLRSIETQ